jgi:hypothetical protein
MATSMRMLTAATALVLAVAGSAAARNPCTRECVGDARLCKVEAKLARRVCKQSCTEQELGPSCKRECRLAFLEARSACRGGAGTCRAACPDADDARHGCARACGSVGAPCHRALVTSARECGRACTAVRRAERGRCIRACANDLHDGATECRAGVRECRESCDPSDPPDPGDGRGACVRDCAAEKRACSEPALSALPGCARGCRRRARRGDMRACLRACSEGVCACLRDFHACKAGCASSVDGAFPGVPPGVFCGSPSGAFLR